MTISELIYELEVIRDVEGEGDLPVEFHDDYFGRTEIQSVSATISENNRRVALLSWSSK